jgi:hypothetical protein
VIASTEIEIRDFVDEGVLRYDKATKRADRLLILKEKNMEDSGASRVFYCKIRT